MGSEHKSLWTRADELATAVADATIGTMIVLVQSARANHRHRRERREEPGAIRHE